MRTQKEWIEAYKEAERLKSDYMLSKIWDINTAQMSQLKYGKTKLDLIKIFDIAESLEIEPIEIILCIEYYREKDEVKKERIKKYILKFASNGLIILAIFGTLITSVSVHLKELLSVI